MNTEDIQKVCFNSGIILIVLGLIHLFSEFLAFEFGLILIIIGIISLIIRKPEMLLVFGILLIFIGVMNIISSLSLDGIFWFVIGGFQIFWGINEIRDYLKFKKQIVKEIKKKNFVWYGLRISFWIMVTFYALDKIMLLFYLDSLGYILIVEIISIIAIIFTFILSIIHLTQYRSKALPIVALVLSSLIFLLTIIGLTIMFTQGFSDISINTNIQYPEITEQIIYEDIELRSLASSMANNCFSGDKECQLNSIYRYIVNNFKYYSDPRSREFIQSPYDTIKVQGGDCEDLTILLNSLLENVGIKTYLVLTKDHAYSLACGLDLTHLQEEIVSSFEEETIVVDEVISIGPFEAIIFGGSGEELNYPMEFTWNIQSDQPIEVHIVPSSDELNLWAKGKSYTYYPSCSKEGVFRSSDSCTVNKRAGVMAINYNYNPATVDIKVKSKFMMIDLNKFVTNYYSVGGDKCVVLDSTLGEYGYPGYDFELEGEKIAIDPVTKETISLK